MDVDWSGWLIFGLIATGVLSAFMIGAQAAHRTRLDLPMMLGTAVVRDPDRARIVGFFAHLGFGQLFALGYALAFAALGDATMWSGALLGAVHAAVALGVLVPLLPGVHPRMASARAGLSTDAFLEPPGFLALNYGPQTPVITAAAHVAYGLTLGVLLGP